MKKTGQIGKITTKAQKNKVVSSLDFDEMIDKIEEMEKRVTNMRQESHNDYSKFKTNINKFAANFIN